MESHDFIGIMKVLEKVCKHKQAYLHRVDLDATKSFFEGFNIALSGMGFAMPYRVYLEAYKQRGWEYTTREVWEDMRDRGMSEEGIINELFALEIQAWKVMLYLSDPES